MYILYTYMNPSKDVSVSYDIGDGGHCGLVKEVFAFGNNDRKIRVLGFNREF